MNDSDSIDDKNVGRILLDEDKPLSECSIWDTLKDLYSCEPARAIWEAVPSYITSNAFIGSCYADLIVAVLQDYYQFLNLDEPIYIVELGSGSGCFSFYLLGELYRKLGYHSQLSELDVKYVMTDFTPSTLADCRDHENFAYYREMGKLSFALFRPEEQSEIVTYGGTRLAHDTIANPVFVIANYIFDSLRQDVFRVCEGRLQEVRHTFYRKQDGKPPSFDQLEKIESYYDIQGDYYDDEDFDSILKYYQEHFRNASILFPLGALRSLRNLQAMSNGKLVLISTDRGFTREDYVRGLWPQKFLSEQIFFSYPVNFFAIRKYFELYGGTSFATEGESNLVHTQLSCMLAEPDCELGQSAYCFTETLTRRNPINALYTRLELLAERARATPDDFVQAYMGLISLCNYDPVAFFDCAEKICDYAGSLHSHVSADLLALLDKVEPNFFRVRQRHDSPFWIGRIRFELGQYDGAISALKLSLAEFGDSNPAMYYLASSYEKKGDLDSALQCFERSLSLTPDFAPAAEGISRLKESIKP